MKVVKMKAQITKVLKKMGLMRVVMMKAVLMMALTKKV